MKIGTQFTAAGRKELSLLRECLRGLNGRILDIGCGDMIDRLGFTPGDEYIGVDIVKD